MKLYEVKLYEIVRKGRTVKYEGKPQVSHSAAVSEKIQYKELDDVNKIDYVLFLREIE